MHRKPSSEAGLDMDEDTRDLMLRMLEVIRLYEEDCCDTPMWTAGDEFAVELQEMGVL